MAARQKNTIGIRALQKLCADTLVSVRNRKAMSEEDIVECRPGGPRSAGTGVGAWLHYYQLLNRFLAVAGDTNVQRRSPSSGTTGDAPNVEALLGMLNSEGETMLLRTPLAIEGAEERLGYLTVEPKGMEALAEIERLNHDTRWLSARLAVLQDAIIENVAESGDLEHGRAVAERLVEYHARIVWILTSPGSECPYDPVRDVDVRAPAHLRALDPIDLTRLLFVAHRVQGDRIELLKGYLPREDGDAKRAVNWAQFASMLAREMDLDPEHLIKHWSREKMVATAVLSAIDRIAAEKAAKDAAARSQRSA